jgi:hypothetical protein
MHSYIKKQLIWIKFDKFWQMHPLLSGYRTLPPPKKVPLYLLFDIRFLTFCSVVLVGFLPFVYKLCIYFMNIPFAHWWIFRWFSVFALFKKCAYSCRNHFIGTCVNLLSDIAKWKAGWQDDVLLTLWRTGENFSQVILSFFTSISKV